MTASYIISACRTPIGKLLGSLSRVPATDLGATVVREALRRPGIAGDCVNEVIMGNVLSAGLGQAPARKAALHGGLPPSVAALTVNKMCGSGLKAVMLADQAIRARDAKVVIAGGMESMSRAPHLLSGARDGWKLGNRATIDSMIHDGLWCPFTDQHMGKSADWIAQHCGVSREDQDAYAAESHQRAISAIDQGAFATEVVGVAAFDREFEQDEGPRCDSTLEKLAKLPPAFSDAGTVTAGNASQISDGAAAVIVADEDTARNIESPIRAKVIASATSGVDPAEIFISPVSAIEKVLHVANMSVADIDLFELNEAFAAQMLACMRPLGLDPDKTNVNGGAIALGHPIGASGARVLVTLLHALAARNLETGLASLCLGGGNAVAMIVQREI
jgi:acetyl-CoA C-acetyltransferase